MTLEECISRLDGIIAGKGMLPDIADCRNIICHLKRAHEAVQWHDLEKEPGDLPEIDKWVIIAFRQTSNVASWNGCNWVYASGIIARGVTAWRELPTREGK